MTQNELILTLLKAGRHITSMEMFSDYGITRLPSRIRDLRQAGHNIGSVKRTVTNRLGHKSSFCEYFLVDIGKENN